MTIHKNLFRRPTIAIHIDSVARIVNVIEVPTCTVTASGIEVKGVGFVAGEVTTRVNSDGVSLVLSAFDLCIVLRQR